jgi:hypothetical protein
MSGYYRDKYPDAAASYNVYSEVLRELRIHKSYMNMSLISISAFSDGNYDDAVLRGDYHTIYTDRISEWASYANESKQSFSGFQADIDNCILKVQEKVDLYNRQRFEREWVADGQ